MSNSVDPDLTPHSAASDPGLHCFPSPVGPLDKNSVLYICEYVSVFVVTFYPITNNDGKTEYRILQPLFSLRVKFISRN